MRNPFSRRTLFQLAAGAAATFKLRGAPFAAGAAQIKIRSVTAIPIAGIIIVEVLGDNGIRGYGEATTVGGKALVSLINTMIAPRLIGQTANDIEKLWSRLFTGLYQAGPAGEVILGISGVEIALFDLLGKSFGLPVYQLLGGKCRDRVKVYASSLGRDKSPEQNAEQAKRMMELGFEQTKLKIGLRWGQDAKPKFDDYLAAKAVAKAIGPGKFSVDANGAYSAPRALILAERLKEFEILFFEEPVPSFDLEGLADLVRRSPIPIATGEGFQTKYEFRNLIAAKGAHILQPDVLFCGGLLETKKIAAMAEAWNLRINAHNSRIPLGFLIDLHFLISTPNCVDPQEFACKNEIFTELKSKDGIEIVKPVKLVQGSFAPSDAPGIGYEIDEKWLKAKREA